MLRPGKSLTMMLACGMLALAHAGALPAEHTMTMTLTSTAFENGAEIPAIFTCEGSDISPALAWHGVPANAKTLVLIVDDPDAPDPAAPKMTWVHWLLYDLPPTSNGLPQAVAAQALPAGTREGRNDWKRTGYGGPCPPIGRHRYFHKLYALDMVLGDLATPDKPKLEAAMHGHVIASAQLLGTYQKQGAR
jgi:hypothetical protein